MPKHVALINATLTLAGSEAATLIEYIYFVIMQLLANHILRGCLKYEIRLW